MSRNIKIAIIDSKNAVSSKLQNIIAKKFPEIKTLDIYDSYGQFLETVEGKIRYDLLFINIILGRKSGVDLAIEYTKYFEDTKLVFYCENMDHAPCIFETKPFGLLAIPFNKEQVTKTIDKAVAQIRDEQHNYIGLKNRQGIYNLNIHDIMMFESSAREVIVHHKDRTIRVYKKLDDVQNELIVENMFIRCHQSFLINRYYVNECTKGKLIMKDGRSIPVSKTRMSEVVSAFEKSG